MLCFLFQFVITPLPGLPLFLAEVSQSVLLVDQQCSVNIFVVRIIEPDYAYLTEFVRG
ncbi:hypothetical protein BMETH_1061_0 [methanotrophic bacterial endosymbiont of Bathymodiolus sp.]|nr:hypothetical protein BMETH_1061_0 [methanotrophic bacterial endosymbiont of Bathymodiolus sp.]